MDALALLCTLHADGPTTLRRFREAGLTRLEDLEAHPAAQLADWIAVEPRTMRRLIREARLLLERLKLELPDDEEAPQGLGFVALDELSGAPSRSASAGGEGALGDGFDQEGDMIVQPVARSERLVPGDVDGLTEGLILGLARAGVHSVDQLARADGLALTSALRIPFAQLRRLQFLARQSAGAKASAPPEARSRGGPFA